MCVPEPLNPLQKLTNNRSLKADPKEAEDGENPEEGSSKLEGNMMKNEQNAQVKSEFVANDESGSGVIREAIVPHNAQEQLSYTPKDDPTLDGISIEQYITRRVL